MVGFSVGWANGFIVNPTGLQYKMLGCQKNGSPTYGVFANPTGTVC